MVVEQKEPDGSMSYHSKNKQLVKRGSSFRSFGSFMSFSSKEKYRERHFSIGLRFVEVWRKDEEKMIHYPHLHYYGMESIVAIRWFSMREGDLG
jgi:hypothetical protein